MTAPPYTIGDRLHLTVEAPAHGGHCVARHDGLVVFVRHALPGERVTAEVTEVRRGHLRADAVEVQEPSPDRVAAPCPHARPGGCGGCDLQHASGPAQRTWKVSVVREQLLRLAGLDADEVDALGLRVDPLPGGLLGWRTRMRFSVDGAGRAGLLAHRSHQVVPVSCRIAHPSIQDRDVPAEAWPGATAVEATAGSTGEVTVTEHRADGGRLVHGPQRVRADALGRQWDLPPGAFWQGHPAAADALAETVREMLVPRPGETAWDLYGGAGLFSALLAGAGAAAVTLVESYPPAVSAARGNLADLPAVRVVPGRVESVLRRHQLPTPVDVVVLDPPRAGAGAAVVRAVADGRPRAVAYVACDPAAFARDLRVFRECGWSLAALRGLDCFPMTHHVELVGLLLPGEAAP